MTPARAHPTSSEQRAARAAAVARFYAEHCDRLHATITHRVHAPTATIEDACQTAWSTLLRRPDIDLDQRGLNWLTTVATREAWRQGSTARELPAGAFIAADLATGTGELPEPAGPAGDPADLALAHDEHNQRVGQLQALKPREREALYLQGLGHSYHAIAALTGSTYTAVNRRITEGRARLRQLDTEPGG